MAREKQHEAGNWEESGFAAGATLRSRGRHLGRREALQPGGICRLGRRLHSLGDVSVGREASQPERKEASQPRRRLGREWREAFQPGGLTAAAGRRELGVGRW